MLDAKFAPEGHEGVDNAGRSVLLLFNATAEDVSFTVPEVPAHAGEWKLRVLTSEGFTNAAD